jgi:large subunit ribosomal protein L18e
MAREKHSLLQQTIVDLKMLQAPVWKRVAKDLSASTSNKRSVNVSKIEKHAKDGLTVVVPGKVLSLGTMTKKIDVAAYQFSEAAKNKITKAGGKAHDLLTFAKKNPDGKQVQIVG